METIDTIANTTFQNIEFYVIFLHKFIIENIDQLPYKELDCQFPMTDKEKKDGIILLAFLLIGVLLAFICSILSCLFCRNKGDSYIYNNYQEVDISEKLFHKINNLKRVVEEKVNDSDNKGNNSTNNNEINNDNKDKDLLSTQESLKVSLMKLNEIKANINNLDNEITNSNNENTEYLDTMTISLKQVLESIEEDTPQELNAKKSLMYCII